MLDDDTDDNPVADTRTRAEKLGDIPRRKNQPPYVQAKPDPIGGDDVPIDYKGIGRPVAVSRLPALTAPEQRLRGEARRLALDYSNQMILNLADIALNGRSEAARIDASKQLLYFGVGRPSDMRTDPTTNASIPHFTIYFGDPNQAKSITIEAEQPILEIDDDHDD